MSAKLRIGDAVPDLTFLNPDGTSQTLSHVPVPTLLIFLRHLR